MLGKSLPKTYLYDSSEMPHMPGSGSANGHEKAYARGGGQSAGGGVIFVEAEGRCRLLGTVVANGGTTGAGHVSGCAGGAIYFKARKLYLDPASVVQSKGGTSSGSGGSGGGGGVAFWRVSDQVGSAITPSMTSEALVALGKVSAAAGNVPDADHCQTHGTVYLGQLPKPGMLIFVK